MTDEISKTIYPWQEPSWQQLSAWVDQGALAQAQLLYGPAGCGKKTLAAALAAKLVGYTVGHYSPDCLLLEPEGKMAVVKVDQIREARDFLAQTAHGGGSKAVIIDQADRLNAAAANALLKTLEEPGPDAFLILTSSRPESLLPTILSRLQRYNLTPSFKLAQNWLQQHCPQQDPLLAWRLTGGAPLTALYWQQQDWFELRRQFMASVLEQKCPVQISQNFHQQLPLQQLLAWLIALVIDAIYLQQGLSDRIINIDYSGPLVAFANSKNLAAWDDLLKFYYTAKQQVNLPVQTNAQLQLDAWLIALLA